MTRIRYTKSGTILESVQSFQVGSELAKLSLNTAQLTFTLTTPSGAVLASGTAVTLAALKKAAKASLISSGMVFDAELRQRMPVTAATLELELTTEQAS